MTDYMSSANGTVNASYTTSTQADLLKQYYVMTLISNMYKKLVIMPLGKIVPMPKSTGTTINFSRINKIDPSITELSEGDSGDSVQVTSSRVSASLVTLGQHTTVSARLVMTALDPILEDYAMEFGKAAADSIDRYVYSRMFKDADNDAIGTTNELFFEDNANDYQAAWSAAELEQTYLPCFYLEKDGDRVATDVLYDNLGSDSISTLKTKGEWGLSIEKINHLAALFEKNSIPEFDDGFWRLVVTPSVAASMRLMDEFENIEAYQSVLNVENGEIGRILKFRVLVTAQIYTCDDIQTSEDMATGVTLAYNLALGKNAFAVSEIGDQPQMIIKTAKGDSSDKTDALNRKNTVGYSWDGAATVIAPDKGCIVVCPTNE